MSSSTVPLVGQLLRFMSFGGANTVVTYVIMVLLAGPLTRAAAFSAAFAVGVALNAGVAGRVIFDTRPTYPRMAAYALWLLVVYVVGLAVLWLVAEVHLQPMPLAMAAPLLLTVPCSFLGARFFLTGQESTRKVM